MPPTKSNNKKENKGKNKKSEPKQEPIPETIPEPIELINNELSIYNLNYSSFTYNLNSLSLQDFNLKIGSKILFESTDLKLARGIRYGLIGKNGSGKSSLIKQFPNLCSDEKLRVLYVEQELILDTRKPVDYIMDSNTKLKLYQEEIAKLNELIRIDSEGKDEEYFNDELNDQLNEVESNYYSYNPEKEIGLIIKILLGLGFTTSDMEKESKFFSGGWQMRLSIARSLYLEPDMLIMDEPTNHLDLEAIIWLSNYLLNWKKIVIIVSHNIGFLNDTCNCILNVENYKLCSYTGNYDAYKSTFNKKHQEQIKKWDIYIKEYDKKKKNSKILKKDLDDWIKKNEVPRPPKENDINIAFPSDMIKVNGPLIEFKDVSFSYDTKEILNNVSFGISMQDKITLVGLNGSGKSTIIKLIAGEIKPTNGEILVRNGIRIGYYNQHFDQNLPLDMSPVEYIRDFVNYRSIELARKHLGNIKLESTAHNKLIGELSGGQKARVAISKLILENPHVILLDEPTNHLDIETVEALIDALDNYNGGILLITHEPELIERVSPKIWYLDMNEHKIVGNIKSFDEYCNLILSN